MPSIERIAVQASKHCLFRCVNNDRRFSANVAAFPRPDGNVSCDLLPTDRCNASDKFNFLLINPILIRVNAAACLSVLLYNYVLSLSTPYWLF